MKWLRSMPLTAIIIIAVLLIATFSLGWYGSQYATLKEVSKNTMQPVRYKDPSYPLINPLVSISIPNATGFSELDGVKKDVEQIITTAKKQGVVSNIGVYFRLPSDAHWFGINENSKFDPGSLIKVPIMIAYFKEAESSPKILEDRLYYNPKNNDSLPNALPAQLTAGTYSASKLLEAMIVDSDNVAKDVLVNHLPEKALQDVFDETNSNFLQDPSGTISPKQYIIMLARLYSATYLDRNYSNYAMQLLTKTTFKDGLSAGVPATVSVAHKYGERGVYEDNALIAIELHDCGLVYAETPYYICIMTKGTDENELASTIQKISAAIYNDRQSFSTTN